MNEKEHQKKKKIEMFQSPAIIKSWETHIIDSNQVIIPMKLDDSTSEIQTDQENVLIRTFRLQQNTDKYQSISCDNTQKNDFCPIHFGKDT